MTEGYVHGPATEATFHPLLAYRSGESPYFGIKGLCPRMILERNLTMGQVEEDYMVLFIALLDVFDQCGNRILVIHHLKAYGTHQKHEKKADERGPC